MWFEVITVTLHVPRGIIARVDQFLGVTSGREGVSITKFLHQLVCSPLATLSLAQSGLSGTVSEHIVT